MIPILFTIEELRNIIKNIKHNNKTVGFVPTMGYLHEGHLSLVKRSKIENDITIISIFVNPTQFGPNEDYDTYPRDLKQDMYMLNDSADYIFAPTKEIMYPSTFATEIHVNKYTKELCGKSRPVHFNGVATVVTKLLNIVSPDNVYFGQKDMQQFLVISQLIKDLNINTKPILCPIIRESDGLAMSSRNVYLNKDEREQAIILYKALQYARKMFHDGEYNSVKIIKEIYKIIQTMPLAKVDYIELRDINTWDVPENIESGNVLLALAVKFGSTRLLDNIIIN